MPQPHWCCASQTGPVFRVGHNPHVHIYEKQLCRVEKETCHHRTAHEITPIHSPFVLLPQSNHAVASTIPKFTHYSSSTDNTVDSVDSVALISRTIQR